MRTPPPRRMSAHDALRGAADRAQDLFVAPRVCLALGGERLFAGQVRAVRPDHFDGDAGAAGSHAPRRPGRPVLARQHAVDIDRDLDFQSHERKHELSHRDGSVVAAKPTHMLVPMAIMCWSGIFRLCPTSCDVWQCARPLPRSSRRLFAQLARPPLELPHLERNEILSLSHADCSHEGFGRERFGPAFYFGAGWSLSRRSLTCSPTMRDCSTSRCSRGDYLSGRAGAAPPSRYPLASRKMRRHLALDIDAKEGDSHVSFARGRRGRDDREISRS